MMEWTDRWCRVFHRKFSKRALLYTEMVTTGAILHGEAERHLNHGTEGPIALQLGGSDPDDLAAAVRLALSFGYHEINLNCGCPSDRVQNGAFGAILMRTSEWVAECTAAMIEAAGNDGPEITVKCRIGVDEQEPHQALPTFIETVAQSGVRSFTVHARKAWLQGLSPKENRTVPPLDYQLVRDLKRIRAELQIVLNGGIETLDDAIDHLGDLDGAMIGRAAYHNPADVLGDADRRVFGSADAPVDPVLAVRGMYDFVEAELSAGTRLNQITRHMLGTFSGRPGARRWRRVLSEQAHVSGAGIEVIEAALAEVLPAQAAE